MECFYDGVSVNWKICFSSGCFPAGNTTAQQNPANTRLQTKQALAPSNGTCLPALPELDTLGGNIFLSTLAATLNVYRDRIDNAACADSDADYLDTLVSAGMLHLAGGDVCMFRGPGRVACWLALSDSLCRRSCWLFV
jgi:hypothetical protein